MMKVIFSLEKKPLELYTKGSAWFSNEQNKKGSFIENQFADFAVLSKDFFSIPDEEIKISIL